jgi:hypothetical protein
MLALTIGKCYLLGRVVSSTSEILMPEFKENNHL